MARELRTRIRGTPGFEGALVHLGVGEPAVVTRADWRDQRAHQRVLVDGPEGEVLRSLPERDEVLDADSFGGAPVAGIEGPDSEREPGLAVVAKRRVGGRNNALAMADLLHRSGDWKRSFPGFVAATPFISPDWSVYVNYPRWVDENAYHAYMADERNSACQEDIARLETSEPEFVMCAPFEEIGVDASGDHEPDS
ncbi:hypothetical protein CEP50_06155 [Actinopolyspora mortivallis]|uniref:ABM domain-containing protein n=1 Tax=Actinopolyspora mortivallis TaxID=33906 RepID=A0A2T0GYP3_ACTMO|nr:hypothetical protein CEP50_06155 [Actinopolyspora mortivallis]